MESTISIIFLSDFVVPLLRSGRARAGVASPLSTALALVTAMVPGRYAICDMRYGELLHGERERDGMMGWVPLASGPSAAFPPLC